MSIKYFLSWFNNGFPNNLACKLKTDIKEKKNLVMISGSPFSNDFTSDYFSSNWFDQCGIYFENRNFINRKSTKKDAVDLINNASVIFLCGGYPMEQNTFLNNYGLINYIKTTSSIVIGASAGSMNMSSQWLSSVNTDQNVAESSLVNGINLADFYFCTKANQTMNDKHLINELLPLSNITKIHVAIDEVAIRLEGNNTDIMGEVYSIENEIIKKLEDTF